MAQIAMPCVHHPSRTCTYTQDFRPPSSYPSCGHAQRGETVPEISAPLATSRAGPRPEAVCRGHDQFTAIAPALGSHAGSALLGQHHVSKADASRCKQGHVSPTPLGDDVQSSIARVLPALDRLSHTREPAIVNKTTTTTTRLTLAAKARPPSLVHLQGSCPASLSAPPSAPVNQRPQPMTRSPLLLLLALNLDLNHCGSRFRQIVPSRRKDRIQCLVCEHVGGWLFSASLGLMDSEIKLAASGASETVGG